VANSGLLRRDRLRLEKIGTDFERRTGRMLSVTTVVAVRMVPRINAGQPFDFLVAAPAQIDELIKAVDAGGDSDSQPRQQLPGPLRASASSGAFIRSSLAYAGERTL
jgi:hypothetical protein